MKLTISDAGGLAQALKYLRELRGRGERTLPLMQVIAQDLENSTRLRFTDGRDPNGVPWVPLSLATRIARARRASGGRVYTKDRRRTTAAFTRAFLAPTQPLRDTGRLANSITSRATNDYAEVGTNVVYAKTHQFGARQGQYGRTKRGAPIPWGNVPARPFLGLSDADRQLIVERVESFILGAMRP